MSINYKNYTLYHRGLCEELGFNNKKSCQNSETGSRCWFTTPVKGSLLLKFNRDADKHSPSLKLAEIITILIANCDLYRVISFCNPHIDRFGIIL